jgi:hypothetical protein
MAAGREQDKMTQQSRRRMLIKAVQAGHQTKVPTCALARRGPFGWLGPKFGLFNRIKD